MISAHILSDASENRSNSYQLQEDSTRPTSFSKRSNEDTMYAVIRITLTHLEKRSQISDPIHAHLCHTCCKDVTFAIK